MNRKIAGACASGLFLSILLAASAQAGTLGPSGHSGCDFAFRGQIEPGDAALLEPIGGSYDGVTLCLDSPGGSFAEGMAMFEAIRDMNIITRIPAGWRCESTCAFAFMAGSITTGLGVPVTIGAHRLELGGMLGFSAPSVHLDSTRSYRHDEVAHVFELALEFAASLYRARLPETDGWRSFNEFLYTRMLEMPLGAMYRIETVADAILAGITLGPVRLPGRITQSAVANLCDAAFLMEQGPMQARAPAGPAIGAWQQLRENVQPADRRNWVHEVRTVELQLQGRNLIGRVGGYAQTRHQAIGCQVEFDEAAANRMVTEFSPFDPDQGVRVQFHGYGIFDRTHPA